MTNTTSRSGRPPKFLEPSRPVTVTLPLRTLRKLEAIDVDRAKAIVKAVDNATADEVFQRVAVIEMAPRTGLLVVPSLQLLRGLPWLTMIQIEPTRFLIAIDSGTPIEKVEVALTDLIEHAKNDAPHEAALIEDLRERFVELRRSEKVFKAELLLIDVA